MPLSPQRQVRKGKGAFTKEAASELLEDLWGASSDEESCFSGSCFVTMNDGTLKEMCDIAKGDLVACPLEPWGGNRRAAVVECVVHFEIPEG